MAVIGDSLSSSAETPSPMDFLCKDWPGWQNQRVDGTEDSLNDVPWDSSWLRESLTTLVFLRDLSRPAVKMSFPSVP